MALRHADLLLERLFVILIHDLRIIISTWWWMGVLVFGLSWLSLRHGLWTVALFRMPATMAHEGAHWLVSMLLGGNPRFPSVWPRQVSRGGKCYYNLGVVWSDLSWWRGPFVGLAPLLLLPAGWWTLLHCAALSPPSRYMAAWLGWQLILGSWPSRQDWVLCLDGGGAILMLMGVFFVAWSLQP